MKTMIGGHQDIHRLKVTEASLTLDGTMAEVFAVDYGFKNVVAVDSLRELPALGQKEPFQVTARSYRCADERSCVTNVSWKIVMTKSELAFFSLNNLGSFLLFVWCPSSTKGSNGVGERCW